MLPRVLLLLAFLSPLGAPGQTVADVTAARLAELKKDFPAQGGVRDEIYQECQACFSTVSTPASAAAALQAAEAAKQKRLESLKQARTDKQAAAQKQEFTADIKWLNGPFTQYLTRWRKLLEELQNAAPPAGNAKPAAGGGPDKAAAALALVASMRQAETAWINAHGGFKADLNKIENAAKALAAAKDGAAPELETAFRTAVDNAVKLAEEIALRPGEKAAGKSTAKDLAAQLKTL